MMTDFTSFEGMVMLLIIFELIYRCYRGPQKNFALLALCLISFGFYIEPRSLAAGGLISTVGFAVALVMQYYEIKYKSAHPHG